MIVLFDMIIEEYNILFFSDITVVFNNFKKRSQRTSFHLFSLSISFLNWIFSRGILYYFCLLLEFGKKRKNSIFRTYRWRSRAEKRKEEIENLLFTRSFSLPSLLLRSLRSCVRINEWNVTTSLSSFYHSTSPSRCIFENRHKARRAFLSCVPARKYRVVRLFPEMAINVYKLVLPKRRLHEKCIAFYFYFSSLLLIYTYDTYIDIFEIVTRVRIAQRKAFREFRPLSQE